MRISDWSSDVCSSDLPTPDSTDHCSAALLLPPCIRRNPLCYRAAILIPGHSRLMQGSPKAGAKTAPGECLRWGEKRPFNKRLCAAQPASVRRTMRSNYRHNRLCFGRVHVPARSEEPTSELQSLMRISYAVFCLKKK